MSTRIRLNGLNLLAQVAAATQAVLDARTEKTAAQAALASAQLARAAAEAARDEAQALVLSDLGTTDGQTRALVENPASQTATALAATFVGLPAGRATALAALPSFLYNAVEINANSFIRSNVLTLEDGTQYAVWWNAGRRPIVGKRTIGGTWSTYDLSLISGNPLVAPVVNDGHCTLSIGRDTDGRLHIAGALHDFTLRYIRTTNPDDITAWTAPGMIGAQENSVTYPQFVTAADGELLFFYRNGTSIAGDLYLNAYDTTTDTWSRRAHVLTGTLNGGDTQNGYIDQPMIAPDGTLALFAVWRIGSTFTTTHDICYLESADNGATWTSIGGAALTLPVRPPGSTQAGAGSEAPVAFPHPSGSGSGLINQCGAVMDSEGRPHTARWLYDLADKSIYRLHHYYWDGAAWVDEVVTTIAGPAATTGTIDLNRPSLFTAPNGRTFIIWRDNPTAPGTTWAQDVTPPALGLTRLPAFPILNVDLGDWEANFDYDAMRAGTLHMLITPTYRDPSQVAGGEEWFGQWGALYSIDLEQIDVVAAGQAPVPGMEFSRNAVATVSTSSATRTDGPAVPLAETSEVLLARATGNAQATTAAASIGLAQRGMDKSAGSLLVESTIPAATRARKTLGWAPLRPDIEDLATGALAYTRQAAGAGGSLDVPALGVEVARVRLGSQPLAYTAPRGNTYDKLGRLAAYWNIAGAGLANDAAVTVINDGAGLARALTPFSSSPTYKTAGINGVGAIRFLPGTALKTPAFAVGNDYTIVTVAACDGTPAIKAAQQILSAWDSAAATPMIAQLRYDAAAVDGGAPASITGVSRAQLGGVNVVTAAISSPATPRVIGLRRSWSTYFFQYELWIDGVLAAAHSVTPSGSNAGATGAAPWYMGGRFSGGAMNETLAGYIGNTVVFDQWLNNAEFRAAMARIGREYAIAMP